MGARRLEVVARLNLAHEGEVGRKHDEGEGGECGCRDEGEAVEAE